MRAALARSAASLAVLGYFWALWLVVAGGFDATVFGIVISSNEPLRPLALAVLGSIVFVLAHGVARTHTSLTTFARRIRPDWVACALAAATLVLGLLFATTAVGGADGYGYVSQAHLWMKGDLEVEQPWVSQLPWPSRAMTATPLGYRPRPADPEGAIVPTYSPGLPLLMAAAGLIGGYCAMFLVVPVLGGGAVLATYGIGKRLGGPVTGLVAAWCVATSPIFLFFLMVPMTDVAVTAAWAAALCFALGRSRSTAVCAGLSGAVALMIRPNLFPIAGVLILRYLLRGRRGEPLELRRNLADAVTFAGFLLPGILSIALIYTTLYGSPLTSGYGRFEDQFALANVVPNIRNYLGWFVQSQTIVGLAGLVAVLLPIRALWPSVQDRAVGPTLALIVGLLWLQYCLYLVFDDWLFLRFLLPTWPIVMTGFGAVAARGIQSRRPGVSLVSLALVVALGLYCLRMQPERNAFRTWRGDRNIVAASLAVADRTPPASVVLTDQHSGVIRYYAGRTTLRYQYIDEDWLDRGMEWFRNRGIPVYAVLDEWEVARFRARFPAAGATRALDTPAWMFVDDLTVLVFDLSNPPPPGSKPDVVTGPSPDETRCVPPAPQTAIGIK